ncbi:cysteinyl-tRNA synthetase [Pseudonocardia ammonioxydans]|uniref:Cysteinyl-tRNA synthetase n=1 Tax=Pseudonocardia ammonioxydans TaxID=260086 RepID=A0A1I5D4H8_PSUAM|nr:cysteine--tRNA ligase [Pseudonocardia ammonioxydans]SFN94122.1 cysteinyl-tRNA synthetase [Pseudonocardia ammonioxydans]
MQAVDSFEADFPAGAGLVLDGTPLPLTTPARIYVCGITPYDVTHLGHAATFVWADVLARVVRMAGTPTEVTRNVTDVDDVLTRTAVERDVAYDEFGLRQEFWFDRSMADLHVRPPDHAPHARHHVRHVIALARTLLATGHAYERDGTVYFRGAGVPGAAGLDRGTALRLAAEYGDEPDDPRRDDPFDVPLWKPSDGVHPAWPSPWGPGRPGWHAECAAMALASLGGVVDVLAGGADLAFPHHAYQSAMAAAATGAGLFARRGFRAGVVSVDGAKMAKSTGNLVLVQDLLGTASGAALRLLLLDRPWAQPWEFRTADVHVAARRLEELYVAAGRKPGSPAAVDAVRDALLTDLDVPSALGTALEAGGDAARLVIGTLALQ